MDIELSDTALELLSWLSDNPGRRVLTQWSGDPQRVRVNGNLLPGGVAAEHSELTGHGLLKVEGESGRWKLTPRGILLSGVRSGRLKNGVQPGDYGGKQRCMAIKRTGKPCQGWARRGSPYCASHPNGSPKPPRPEVPVFVERADKLSPAAKKNRNRRSKLPKIEIMESRLKPPEPSQKLYRLPEVAGEEKVAPCERHGVRLCSQAVCLAAEEENEYDRLAGRRLLAARPLVY